MDSDCTADQEESQLNDLDESDLTESCTETKQNNTPKPVSSITLKKQPEQLCNCPLHCDNKISKEWKGILYKQFQDIADHALQNQYIQRHIKIKSIAKRLWEDEVIDKKIQRRVTCKYLIPMTGSVMESFNYARTLNYDSVRFSLHSPLSQENGCKLPVTPEACPKLPLSNENEYRLPVLQENGNNLLVSRSLLQENGCVNLSKDSIETQKTNNCVTENTVSIQSDNDSPMPETPSGDTIKNLNNVNGVLQDLLNDSLMIETPSGETNISVNSTNGIVKELLNTRSDNSTKENSFDVNSPMSFNDNDSVNTGPDDLSTSELDYSIPSTNVKYVEVCQKAFMNMYGITEKRIRWQREKLILKSRFLAEKKRKELEEMDRTLSLARSLGAGCQPLFALLEKSNCTHLSEQLMGAIEDDVALVNNFFHNQLWKPEDILNKSVHFPSLDSLETECD